MAEELRLELLGGVRLTRDGAALSAFVSSKAPALLCYLAVTGRPQFRTTLAGLLWSEMPEDVARRNLRIVLANLRQTLAPHLLITRDTIAFDRTSAYWLDVDQVEAALHQDRGTPIATERLRAAVTLYGGDFLEGFSVRDAPTFDEWATAQRERLRRRILHVLHDLVGDHTAHGEYAAGVDACTRLLQLDPWREDAHRHLMRLLALSGQPDAALAQYAACCRMLEAELGADASEETTRLYTQIRDGVLVPLRPKAVADSAPAMGAHWRPPLPPPSTAVIGRDLELAQIAQRLSDPTCRLLTVIGAGGIGKTQLALRAAADHAAEFPDGVAWVPLVAAGSGEEMLTAIAAGLGLTPVAPHGPRTQVLDYLREKRLLLLLDNLEHLREAPALIHAILAAAPRVVVLATARERLNVQAEWLLDVRGLSYPLATHEASVGVPDRAHLERYAAIQLFAHRATRVQPEWTLCEATLPAVIRICQLVHGMPLGIELAAAWVRTTPCLEIADEVARNLDFLATTLWDVPARHRSLRAVFDYSWGLLAQEERAILAQLAVLRGGFDSAAARAVAHADRRQLATLIDTSLLQRDAGGRCILHEAVRQFAAERLATEWPDRAEATQGRQSAYYLDSVHTREEALRGRAVQQTLAELRADLDNIRQAWQWAAAHGQITALDRATGGLALVYELSGLLEEGATVFGAAAARVRGLVTAHATPDRTGQRALSALLVADARFLTHQAQFTRAMEVIGEALALARAAQTRDLEAVAAHQAGQTLARQAHYGAARTELEHALTLARSMGLPGVEADSLFGLGETALWQGDFALAWRYHQHALELYRTLGTPRGEGAALNQLGLVALLQGDYDAAEAYETQALGCYRAVGSPMDEGFVLLCLGQIALARTKDRVAETFYDQALRLYRTIGNRHGEILALAYRGYVPLQQGAYPAARAAFEHALGLHRAIADRRGECDMLANLGLLAHLLGDDTAALTLSRQALGIAHQIGHQQFEARALTFLGHALTGLGRLEEAETVYEQAVRLRRALHQEHLALEPFAGPARVAHAHGDLPQARAHVADMLTYLATGTLGGTFEPLRVYLTCYQVLRAVDDPHATAVLRTAYGALRERADAIGDAETRRSFVENVTVHRALARAYTEVVTSTDVAVPPGW